MSRHQQTIVVIGGGGHAKVLISVLRKLAWHVAGYTDAEDRGTLLGAPHLGDDAVLPGVLATYPDCAAILGVGKVDASLRRSVLQQKMESLGFHLPVIISPNAVVNLEAELGPGSVVFDGAVVNTGTITGPGCIINTNATLEHDCRLGADVHIAPGATVSGGVTVGDHSCIGAGAVVIQGLTITDRCLIGAGSVVTGNIQIPGTYVGVPARRIRE
jgi:sugar O-acyltransferase (sialic acid O-acetyltransferase NeuD family)